MKSRKNDLRFNPHKERQEKDKLCDIYIDKITMYLLTILVLTIFSIILHSGGWI